MVIILIIFFLPHFIFSFTNLSFWPLAYTRLVQSKKKERKRGHITNTINCTLAKKERKKSYFLLLCCVCCLFFAANQVHNRGDIYGTTTFSSFSCAFCGHWLSTLRIPSSVRDCFCFFSFLPYISIGICVSLQQLTQVFNFNG